jgi:hypothetical protein
MLIYFSELENSSFYARSKECLVVEKSYTSAGKFTSDQMLLKSINCLVY